MSKKLISYKPIIAIAGAQTETLMIDEATSYSIVVKKLLAEENVHLFVDNVVSAAFVGDKYCPQNVDFAIRENTIRMYSNLNLPENVDDKSTVLYCGGIYDKVIMAVNVDQYRRIISSIDDLIDYKIHAIMDDERRKIDEAAEQIVRLSEIVEPMLQNFDIVKSLETLNKVQDIKAEDLMNAAMESGVAR